MRFFSSLKHIDGALRDAIAAARASPSPAAGGALRRRSTGFRRRRRRERRVAEVEDFVGLMVALKDGQLVCWLAGRFVVHRLSLVGLSFIGCR